MLLLRIARCPLVAVMDRGPRAPTPGRSTVRKGVKIDADLEKIFGD